MTDTGDDNLKQIILGTAGHIDHGKTTLIKAVSGIDTDRLKEEKQRGITIELGFAAIDLPSKVHIGVVDVPGHEKFVKNMVAGASGIDVVAMIIAADEGVMPQTREHLEICDLLGVEYGFVALTKIDMVDEEWLELVMDDVKTFTQGTFLENSPIVPVSSVNGEGIDRFVQTLDEYCRQIPDREASSLFRLPADRVFTIKGFGTVITGTLISGKIGTGEPVMIYPSGIKTKVRGLQVHDQPVNEAEAGMRTAINFQGIEKTTVNRGDVVARPDTLRSTYMTDVEFQYLESNERPIKNRENVRFHTGTSEIPCRIILLDREEIIPGEKAIVQLRLDAPVACVRDDRFVVRSYSPVRTLGGGRILSPVPKKHKRFRQDVIMGLQKLLAQDPETLIDFHLQEAGYSELTLTDLTIMTNLSTRRLDDALQSLLSKQAIIQTDKSPKRYIHQQTLDQFKNEVVQQLSAYHTKHPLKAGMPKGELKSKFPPIMSSKLFNQLIHRMVQAEAIYQTESAIRLPDHEVRLAEDESDLRQKILDALQREGLQPPLFKDLVSQLNIRPETAKNIMMLLVNEGKLIKAKDDLFFHADAIKELQARLVAYLKSNGDISTPEFKEMTGASRKYTIPLLEYFDATNITIRVGDNRKLRKSV